MPSMPTYYLGKGSQFGMLDRQFGGTEQEFLAQYRAALGRIDEPLAELASEHSDPTSGLRAELTDTDVQHFRDHWLGTWWPRLRIEAVLRAGFREAITLAEQERLPIETLWVCADEKTFQVYICQGPRQVTVIVFTPRPKEHVGHETLTEPEPIWVVKEKDDDDWGAVERVAGADGDPPIIKRQLFYAPDPARVRRQAS
jgi:hypothetical protein